MLYIILFVEIKTNWKIWEGRQKSNTKISPILRNKTRFYLILLVSPKKCQNPFEISIPLQLNLNFLHSVSKLADCQHQHYNQSNPKESGPSQDQVPQTPKNKIDPWNETQTLDGQTSSRFQLFGTDLVWTQRQSVFVKIGQFCLLFLPDFLKPFLQSD